MFSKYDPGKLTTLGRDGHASRPRTFGVIEFSRCQLVRSASREVIVKSIDLQFSTGHDALRSYWGHLNGGGLSFPHEPMLTEGQTVDLHIDIASRAQLKVRGRVIRQHAERTFVAFDDRTAQGKLLRAAASADPSMREAVESALQDG